MNQTRIRATRKKNVAKRRKKAATKIILKGVVDNVTSVVYSQLINKAESKKKSNKKKKDARDSFDGSKPAKYEFQTEQLRVGEEFEERFAKAMNQIFRAQEKEILEKLPSKVSQKDLLDVKRWTTITVEKFRPIIAFLIGIQSTKTFQLLGQQNRLTPSNNTKVADYLATEVPRFSKDITIQTNKIIADVINDSIAEGLSTAQTSAKIRESFTAMEKSRSDRIARSEIIRATSVATEESFIVSEVVELKEWLTFIDERTDEACLALDGKTLGLGKDYFKKGDSTHGVNIDYENIAGPPLHVNCRCTLVPVVIA